MSRLSREAVEARFADRRQTPRRFSNPSMTKSTRAEWASKIWKPWSMNRLPASVRTVRHFERTNDQRSLRLRRLCPGILKQQGTSHFAPTLARQHPIHPSRQPARPDQVGQAGIQEDVRSAIQVLLAAVEELIGSKEACDRRFFRAARLL